MVDFLEVIKTLPDGIITLLETIWSKMIYWDI